MKPGSLIKFNPVYLEFDHSTGEYHPLVHFWREIPYPQSDLHLRNRFPDLMMNHKELCILLEKDQDHGGEWWCKILTQNGTIGWMRRKLMITVEVRGCT